MLERIQKANDIKNLKREELPQLAQEIREFLVDKVSRTGGHLASNLGVVELTMALHLAFQLPEDKIIWDVGHQSYTHKILTGRREGFEGLRKYGGMSGFPKRRESDCDAFGTGHSSTSISAGLGYAHARDIRKKNYKVVSVIGDGALTGGMAFEALNNATRLEKNFIIVLNDNNMSISENVGGMSRYLNGIRTGDGYLDLKKYVTNVLSRIPVIGDELIDKISRTKNGIKQLLIPGMLFENMGITYLGPVDGHDVKALSRALKEAKKLDHAVLVHVITKKGKGYEPAEKNPARFHGVEPFDVVTGESKKEKKYPSYTDVFSRTICQLAEKDPKITAVTAAMPDGTGLKRFSRLYPDRFFDVGIAEEHAVSFAAGLALGGVIPVVAIYSSFLQRAVDQMLHDVCMQKLHVIFAVDRAGLVGADGETHQGNFDISYLSMMPGMTVMAPKNDWELKEMLRFAVKADGPVAIRYPRGNAYQGLQEYQTAVEMGKSEVLHSGCKVAVLALGSMVEICADVCSELQKAGIDPTFVNVRFVKPLDTALLDQLARNHSLVVTVEENVQNGGFGQQVCGYMEEYHPGIQVLPVAIPDRFVPHGGVDSLRVQLGLSANAIAEKIKKISSSYSEGIRE